MAPKLHVKKNDTVIVSGVDRETGRVLEVLPKTGVVVEGVRLQRSTPDHPRVTPGDHRAAWQAGCIEVQVVCPHCDQPTDCQERNDDGFPVRSKKCGKQID